MSTKSRTSTLLASKLKLDNILQLTLVQSTLQANFKAVLEALADHDTDLDKFGDLTQQHAHRIDKLDGHSGEMAKELDELREIVARLGQENQAMKIKIDQKKDKNPNPESQITSQAFEKLVKQLSTLKDRTLKLQLSSTKIPQSTKIQLQLLKKQLCQQKKSTQQNTPKLKQLQKLMKDLQSKNKDLNEKIHSMEKAHETIEKRNQDSIKMFATQANQKLKQFVNGRFREYCDAMGKRVAELERQLEEVKASLEEEKRIRGKLSQEVWNLHDSLTKVSDQNFEKQLNLDSLKQLRRQVSDLSKKMNDAGLTGMNGMNGMNSTSKNGFNGFTSDTTFNQSPNKTKLRTSESPQKQFGDLREEMLSKLKQLKSDMLRNMKKIDQKAEGESGFDRKRLDALEEAILRIQHILAEKAGLNAVKKLIQTLDNKISYMYNLYIGDSEEDACIARKNWACLSCDKNLDKYQGRMGLHLINDKLKIKPVDQETLGGGMSMKNSRSRLDLPNVKTAKRL